VSPRFLGKQCDALPQEVASARDLNSHISKKNDENLNLNKYNKAPVGGREPLDSLQLYIDADLDIECAAQKFGSARQWPQSKILELTAKWKAAFFMELTGFDVKFPVGLTIVGACAFVEASKNNQWLSREYNRRGGVDGFIEKKFGYIIKDNNIPVSLIKYTDKELYTRIAIAHATGFRLPNGIIYDVTGGEKRRPRMKPTAPLASCRHP
jgi:hypothetical protein